MLAAEHLLPRLSPVTRPRVLHILTQLELGGAQLNTLASVEDQVRRGYDARLVAAPGTLAEEASRRLGDRWISCPALVRPVAPLRDVDAYRVLREICRRFRPHIVHTHSSKAGILGRWAAHRAGVPVILHTAHGWGFHRGQSRAAYEAFRWAERLAASWTRRLIVVADSDRAAGRAAGVGNPGQYLTIRSGVSLDVASLLASRARTRVEWGIPEDAILAVWVGNFKAQKAPLIMARVVRAALAECPTLHILIVGDGPLRAAVASAIDGVPRATLCGWQIEAARILAASDILLNTSLHEGLPRVVLEACALGVPSVATAVDGIPEILDDGVTGFLTAPGDVLALTDGLMRLARDAALRARCGVAARAAFRSEFRLSTMLDQLDALYRRELKAVGETVTGMNAER